MTAWFETVQAYYSIAGRELEREIVPVVEDQGLGVMVWSPLAGGFLSGKYTRDKRGDNDSRRTVFDFPPVDKERAYDRIDAMAPIVAEPFYAVELAPSMLNPQGGPRRNERGQIVRPDGTPIARLYSAGELGSIYSYLYQGTGNIGECLAFGRVSGRNAAAEMPLTSLPNAEEICCTKCSASKGISSRR